MKIIDEYYVYHLKDDCRNTNQIKAAPWDETFLFCHFLKFALFEAI